MESTITLLLCTCNVPLHSHKDAWRCCRKMLTFAALEMGRASAASAPKSDCAGVSLLADTESACVKDLLWLEDAKLRAESAASLLPTQHSHQHLAWTMPGQTDQFCKCVSYKGATRLHFTSDRCA